MNHSDTTINLDPSAPATAAPATPQAQPAAPSEHEAMVATIAAERLAALTSEQRAAVVGLAGGDPLRQIEAIKKLAPTWARSAPDTAPRPGAPRDVVFGPSPDQEATWQNLHAVNPVLASRWALANGVFDKGGR